MYRAKNNGGSQIAFWSDEPVSTGKAAGKSFAQD
jgi:hypothetical protein